MGTKLMWAALGLMILMVVGGFLLSAIAALFKLAIYLAFGLLLVGGALALAQKARKLGSGSRRRELR